MCNTFPFLVAKRIVATEQNMRGKVVGVKLVDTEMHNSETLEVSRDEFRKVLVSGLPEGTTQNSVHIHFQKKKNGGGEIKEVKLRPEKNEATVVFKDIEG